MARPSIISKLKDNKKTEILKTQNKIVVKVDNVFNYDTFPENEREVLKELEQRATFSGDSLKNNIMELGEVFIEAQRIFSKKGNGMFGVWYEKLSFKKDFVYMCIDRKNLSLEYKDEKVYQLPDKVIKDIKKIKNPKAVKRILQAENVKEAIKEEFKQEAVKNKNSIKEETSSVATEEVILSKVYVEEQILQVLELFKKSNLDEQKLKGLSDSLSEIEKKFLS